MTASGMTRVTWCCGTLRPRCSRACVEAIGFIACFYRLGGEEFVLWLPDVGRAQAEAVLERLREQIREHVRTGEGEAVTVSMGVAAHHAGEHWRDCLARADQALYRAKSAGRNRVEWAVGDAIERSIPLVERRA
jgi:PleD family two-component response regulator